MARKRKPESIKARKDKRAAQVRERRELHQESVEQIRRMMQQLQQMQEHMDAGADHVCIQPVNPNGQFGELHWECLEAVTS